MIYKKGDDGLKAVEFKKWLEDNQPQLGMWTVETEKKVVKDFTMGCYFDSDTNKWTVYIVGERGQYTVWLETEDEDKAYDELQSMVIFEQRNNKGYC